ncbi:MAG: CBS domain-containing protein [Nitrospirales bacterium]
MTPKMRRVSEKTREVLGEAPPASVQRIMAPGVIQIPGDLSIREAALIMQEEKTSCLLVKGSETKYGFLTQAEIVQQVVARGLDPEQVEAQTVMTRPVHSIEYDQPAEAVTALMAAKRISQVLVTKGKQPIGLVSVQDIVFGPFRRPIRLPVSVTVQGGNAHGTTLDGLLLHLTHVGGVVELPAVLPAGASLSLQFTLPGSHRPILAHATVLRTAAGTATSTTDKETARTSEKTSPTNVEIRFSRLSPSDKSQIAAWAMRPRVRRETEV